MGARSIVNRLGCACASIVVLIACAREGGRAATNAPTPAINVATLTAAPPPPANTSQSDLFPIDTNAADSTNATNTVDPGEASLLAEKNADCVDQLIKAQPFGESRSEVIDNVTKACLPIAKWEAQASPKPLANVDASERSFVAGRVHDLIDGPSP
jgi:hypothetical protein